MAITNREAMNDSYTLGCIKLLRNNCRVAMYIKLLKADISAVMSEFKGRKAKGFE